MESLETIGRKDVVRDNVRNPPAFYLGIIRRTAERMAGAVPATGGVPAGGAPPGRHAGNAFAPFDTTERLSGCNGWGCPKD